ncbi:MAG: glycosyltransferase [Sphingobacteriaceae bacterium]|nr:glycosyltransferase [Sphingobacteriaceae bacterium]
MEQNIKIQPLISIITVCFNSERTIRQTIESVLNQTYTNIEYILVDGKSTDSTVTIIEEYAPLFAERGIQYRWVSEPDDGIYDAINKGIKLSSGDWVNVQGSDDWLELNACDVVNLYGANIDVLYGFTRMIMNGICLRIGQNMHDNLEQETINHQSIFMKKYIHNEIGVYSLDYLLASDYEFLLRAKNAGYIFKNIEVINSNYSLCGYSGSNYDLSTEENARVKFNHGIITRKELFVIRLKLKLRKLLKIMY